MVGEPTIEETIESLPGSRQPYEEHHNLDITDEAIFAAANLSARYVPDRFLPDKAIDLIDEGSSRVRMYKSPESSRVKRLENDLRVAHEDLEIMEEELTDEEQISIQERIAEMEAEMEDYRAHWDPETQRARLTADDVAEVVGMWTGIPVTTIAQEESERLLRMEEELHKRIVGQHEAIEAISKAVRRARAGLKDPRRPIGSFVFLGPTGVGKTELTKALAEFVADRPGSEALYAPLKADLEGAEKIWQLLSKSIDAAVKARKPLALTFPSDRLGGPTEGRFRLTGLAHDRLSFAEIDGKRRKDLRSLFDLAPEALGALLGEPNLKAPLGLLCLLRAGPDSAMASLLANDLPAGVRAANERHLDALSGFWLDARHASLKRFREETAAAKNPPLEALGFSAREALTLLLAWKSAHPDIVAALKAWFLADRRQYLASGPLDSFFHAPTVKSPRAGFVHLVYDFATEDQVADFVTAVAAKPPGRTGARPEPAPEEKPAVRWLADKKAMQLTGEARFLREDPFEESIIVTGKVTGCFPESPNVNIAFFTSATDRVTIALGELDLEAWWRRRGQPCLLYTSDAADDLLCVDLGGRRIIKKKKT